MEGTVSDVMMMSPLRMGRGDLDDVGCIVISP